MKELSQQPMVLLQPVTTTRAVIDGAFGKTIARCTLNEMEASTYVEIKRYVASAIDISIIHDICLAQDHNLFRTVNLENIFPHPRARLIYYPSSLSVSPQKLIVFVRFASD